MSSLGALWGTEFGPATVNGHPGLAFEPRPTEFDHLLAGADRWADREFLVQADRRITHGEFHAAIPAAAGLLERAGVRPGDRVLLLSYNSPEFVLALWGLWWLGAVPVFGNRWWSETELEHALGLTKPVLALTDRADWAPSGVTVRQLGDLSPVFGTSEDRPCARADDEDAPALILFTSGSAGVPKAVVLSRRSVIANQHNTMARTRRLPQDLDPSRPQAVAMVCTPLFHVGGIGNIVLALLTGTKLVFNAGKFDPGQVLELIEAEGVQSFAGVPTMASRLIEHPDFTRRDVSSLRALPFGGAPVPPALLERLVERLPQLKRGGLGNTWGMTESGGFMASAGAADLAERPGTVGPAASCAEIRIADPGPDGVGEVVVRAPTMMLGYLGADGTLEGVDAEGWLRTGDLGRLDADGYLYLTGRAKDIVIRGGENIACAHVESTMLTHPQIVEAAVFGIPHDDLGEELAAVGVHTGPAPTQDELREFLRARLAYFEVPTAWAITTEPLPTLAGEKIDKKTLKSTFVRSE
ncbi:class I adenylate-forming enzyme family protein [Sporichthya sp.]|uniref:class I adenylate-forming enzyme family protein n=1 Tax=Sporichthya sp. TaxID=65475 RepID=UPI0017BF93DB|nr:class I adenylate-forming enzyme family protein [Sporichthya sp.]MBA3744518.1 acyl--CoA ligase [Sporichthya sp.]